MSRAFLLVLFATLGVACDPTHDDAVAALGDEAPGVRRGPLHRPGQPCLLCHDGAIGDPPQFSVAGTVYLEPAPNAAPASNVNVHMTDANGASFDATTNAAGNFYVVPGQFTPTYPMTVSITASHGTPICMFTHVGRDGSCAGCHAGAAGPGSPGQINLKPAKVADCRTP